MNATPSAGPTTIIAALRAFFGTTDTALGFYIARPERLVAVETPPPVVAVSEESDDHICRPMRVLTPDASACHFFGAELRHHRLRVGLTLEELAPQVLASAALLGKVEAASRFPSRDLAQRCDTVLETGGILARLHRLLVAERAADSRARAVQLTDAEAQALRVLLAALRCAAIYPADPLPAFNAVGLVDGRDGFGLFAAEELLRALFTRDPSKRTPPLKKTPAELIAEALDEPAAPGLAPHRTGTGQARVKRRGPRTAAEWVDHSSRPH